MKQALKNKPAIKPSPSRKEPVNVGFVENIELRYPLSVLRTLLRDHTTGKNIIWADNEYSELGDDYLYECEITVDSITGLNSGVIKPRIDKGSEKQSTLIRNHAEVFTPSWLCNHMNNFIDEEWFGYSGVFNTESSSHWIPNTEQIYFPKKKGHGWHAYVISPRLEITCGEAPFICSRYDTVSGNPLPIISRVGFLDRKLRVVSEQTKTYKTWFKWATEALKSTYGYEYQGDNLVIARINVLETFIEHAYDRWEKYPSVEEIGYVAEIISWNIWQMDGLNYCVPMEDLPKNVRISQPGLPVEYTGEQLALFGFEEYRNDSLKDVQLCTIYNWSNEEEILFASLLRTEEVPEMKKFYAVIGNPPYQEEQEGDNDSYSPPIYNHFMDQVYKISERAELIHPARFLFDSGSTPKAWNNKMLNDAHFKILDYESDSKKIFPGQEITGGIAVSYRNCLVEYGAIKTFLPYDELRSVLDKVTNNSSFSSLMEIIYIQTKLNLDVLYSDYPECKHAIGSNGTDPRFEKNIFFKVPAFRDLPSTKSDVRTLGIKDKKRTWMFIPRKYVVQDEGNLNYFKVIVSVSNGAAGTLGNRPARICGAPFVGNPGDGFTRSFIGIGAFEKAEYATNCAKYVESKFARALLGTLKITQMINKDVWKNVPLQDFTPSSDIDWSKTVAEIDKQLYKKYGLSGAEVDFIESHVKEME